MLNASAQVEGPVYIVQPGDTLTSIAQRFGTTVEAIVEVNAILDPGLLIPGETLVIPGFAGVSGILEFTEVGFGESLASLSLRYGVEKQTLARLNRTINPGRVFVGMQLIKPDGDEGDNRLATGTTWIASEGVGRVEIAALENLNPWEVAPLDERSTRTWFVGGELLVLPGEGSPTTSLPHPIKHIQLQPQPAVQGRTEIIRIGLEEPAWAEGRLAEYPLVFNSSGELELVALQGVHALMDPGLYDLEISLSTSQGGETTFEFIQPVRVISGDYGFGNIIGVPPETIAPEVREPEYAMVEAMLSENRTDRLWEGLFEYPSRYYLDEFLSEYGTRRNYNYGAFNYYHTGLDFYGIDIPIYASARGQVVFADFLTVRGNVTYIDHGWGVYSGYLHQSEMYVEEGDLVERGQLIGQVGNTGRSTGPHLHWEIWVGGIPVEPMEWVTVGFP